MGDLLKVNLPGDQRTRSMTFIWNICSLEWLFTSEVHFCWEHGGMISKQIWFCTQSQMSFVLKINDQCLTQSPTTPRVYFCHWTHFWESVMINIWKAKQISNQTGPGYRFSPAGAISNIKMQYSPSQKNKNGRFSPWCNFLPLWILFLYAVRSSKGL